MKTTEEIKHEVAKEFYDRGVPPIQGAQDYTKECMKRYARAALESINIEVITERIDKVSFIPFDFEKNVKEILKSSITDIELP